MIWWRMFVLALLVLFSPARALAQDAAAPATDGGAAAEPAATPEVTYPRPERVTVGVHLNDIQTVDLKTHSYQIDAYFWFRWRNPTINPASTERFEFINPSELWGHIRTANYEEPEHLPNGEMYQVIRVQGRFSKKLPLFNYPFDRQVLTITFEDTVAEASDFVYVPGEVTVNPSLSLPGFRVGTPRLVVREEAYPTRFGDLRLTAPSRFSRGTIEIPLTRPPVAYAFLLFFPVLCVFLCSALMFLLNPSYVESRVGVGITALLTIVALQMTFNQDLPDVGYLMLMDKIYICSYVFVIAGLGLVVHTARMVKRGEEEAAVALHRRSLVVLSTLYFLISGALVTLAAIEG